MNYHWRRYAVKYRGEGSGSACRRLEKLVLPSIVDTSLSFLMMRNLQSYPSIVLNERMWHFRRGQNILWPLPHIFRGSRLPSRSEDLRPCELCTFQCWLFHVYLQSCNSSTAAVHINNLCTSTPLTVPRFHCWYITRTSLHARLQSQRSLPACRWWVTNQNCLYTVVHLNRVKRHAWQTSMSTG